MVRFLSSVKFEISDLKFQIKENKDFYLLPAKAKSLQNLKIGVIIRQNR